MPSADKYHSIYYSAREAILVFPRAEIDAIVGILFRHARLIGFYFAFIVISAVCVVAVLRPVFSATALLMVEPAGGDLLSGGSGLPMESSPDNSAVDGAVEILRSEPVFQRALDLAAPFERADLSLPVI